MTGFTFEVDAAGRVSGAGAQVTREWWKRQPGLLDCCACERTLTNQRIGRRIFQGKVLQGLGTITRGSGVPMDVYDTEGVKKNVVWNHTRFSTQSPRSILPNMLYRVLPDSDQRFPMRVRQV